MLSRDVYSSGSEASTVPDLSVVGPGAPAFADAEPEPASVADAEPEPLVRTFKVTAGLKGPIPCDVCGRLWTVFKPGLGALFLACEAFNPEALKP